MTPEIRSLDELYAQGRDVSALVLHLLDHLPPGEIVPADCQLVEDRAGWTVVTPAGDAYGLVPGRGAAYRYRRLEDGRREYVEFEAGELLDRAVFGLGRDEA